MFVDTYCKREDVEAVYGATNVFNWADIDGNGDTTQIEARINWARRKAYTRINGRLRRRNFDLPFDLNNVPYEILDIEAQLAGFYLFQARMLDGEDRTKNNLSHMYKSAEGMLDEIVGGIIKLDVDMEDYTDAPSVYDSSNDE